MNDPFLDRAGEDDPVIFFRRPTPPADDLGCAAEVGPELRRRVRTVAVSAVVVAGGLLLARPRELLHFGAKVTRNTLVFLVLLCALVTLMEGLLIAEAFGYQPFWRP